MLFRSASLFDVTDNLAVTSKTFKEFAKIELLYRNLDPHNIAQVLDDIYQTSLSICLKGQVQPDNFKILQAGIKRIQNFIHSEKYNIDSAIVNASKAAYLSILIANGVTEISRFDPQNVEYLREAVPREPSPTKLNKLKKTNVEAFFYWNEIGKILNR